MDKEALKKGRSYYRHGRVLWVIKSGETIFGKVLGTYPYYVEINTSTGENTCTCPLGGDCKHVAAVSIAYESGDFVEIEDIELACLNPEAAAWSYLVKHPKKALDVTMKELLHSMELDESGSLTAMLFLRALKLSEELKSKETIEKLREILDEYSEVFSDYELAGRLRDRVREALINIEIQKEQE